MKRGDSLMEEHDLFQGQGGGSAPTSPLQFKVYECLFGKIQHIFRDFHYKSNHIGGGITQCYQLNYGGGVFGGAIIGKLRHDKTYSKNGKKYLELRRFACRDDCPKNTESYFISKIIMYLKKSNISDGLISYSDLSVGHVGTIYKASNFKLIGKTTPTKHVFWDGKRYHPRSLTIDRPYSYELRNAINNGNAEIVDGEPKLVFLYEFKRVEHD